MVWFCFCFAAAFPPMVDLLSAFSSLHGMLHSFLLLVIFLLFFPSCFTASTGSLLPLGDLGDYWVGHLFPPPPQVAVTTCFLVFSLLVSKHSESQPMRVQLLMVYGQREEGCCLLRLPGTFSFSWYAFQLSTYRFNSCLCLSPFFFILFFFPSLFLRYVKYSQ